MALSLRTVPHQPLRAALDRARPTNTTPPAPSWCRGRAPARHSDDRGVSSAAAYAERRACRTGFTTGSGHAASRTSSRASCGRIVCCSACWPRARRTAASSSRCCQRSCPAARRSSTIIVCTPSILASRAMQRAHRHISIQARSSTARRRRGAGSASNRAAVGQPRMEIGLRVGIEAGERNHDGALLPNASAYPAAPPSCAMQAGLCASQTPAGCRYSGGKRSSPCARRAIHPYVMVPPPGTGPVRRTYRFPLQGPAPV